MTTRALVLLAASCLAGHVLAADAAKSTSKAAKVPKAADHTPLVEEVKKAAAYDLKDPSSAQFRSVIVAESFHKETKQPNGFNVCGEMNAKNSYGAYTGFKRFMGFKGKDGKVTVFMADNPIFALVVNDATNCEPVVQSIPDR